MCETYPNTWLPHKQLKNMALIFETGAMFLAIDENA